MKVVIVGGVAGGASAAARLRRLDEQAEIVIFERSGYISYANCGLPYYIGGIISDADDLTLQSPKSFNSRFNVSVNVLHEVIGIDAANKCVSVRNLSTGEEFTESYDKLILSPGAKPTMPQLPGLDNERIFTLRTVEDTMAIHAFIDKSKPKSAVIAGGGYIGIEMAENLRHLGLDVTIVQRPKQLLNTLDQDMASFVHAKMRAEGITLKLGSSVTGFESNGSGLNVLLKDEAPISTDMVLMAVGVSPDTTLAKLAGLELGIKGSIVVNEHMETSLKDIYAVGDAVEVKHYITGDKALISLAGPANKQGRIAADNICGIQSVYRGTQGSSVIKLFDLTVATTGINEVAAQKAGLSYEKLVLSPASHAGYYPGGKIMTIKLLYEKESLRILGAQIVGGDGADKRIDVIATAIRAGLKVTELQELELAYAPPYSSAKDPVNLAGFMADNIVNGRVKQFHWNEIPALRQDENAFLLDSRTPGEYARGYAEGFVNIPLDKIRQRIGEIPAGKRVYVMCQSGLRSYIACRMIEQLGFECYNFSGGYRFYNSVYTEQATAQQCWPCGMDK